MHINVRKKVVTVTHREAELVGNNHTSVHINDSIHTVLLYAETETSFHPLKWDIYLCTEN